jgi:hypothetical protein
MCGEFCTLPALFLKIIFNFSLRSYFALLLESAVNWREPQMYSAPRASLLIVPSTGFLSGQQFAIANRKPLLPLA